MVDVLLTASVQQLLQHGARDETHKVAAIDNWEALKVAVVQQRAKLRDARVPAQVNLRQDWVHDVATPFRKRSRKLLFQERVALENNVQVVDALSEDVSHHLGHQHCQHEGNDVRQAPGELQHDRHQGYGHPAHSAQDGGCPDHGVDPGLHVLRKEAVPAVHRLHRHPHAAAEARTGEERGHEEPGWACCAEGQRGLEQPYGRGAKQRCHEGHGWVGVVVRRAEPNVMAQVRMPRPWAAVHEESVDGVCAERPREHERPGGDERHDGDEANLRDAWDALPEAMSGTDCRPAHVDHVEDCTHQTTHNAQQSESKVFQHVAVRVVAHREECDTLGPVGVGYGEHDGSTHRSSEGPDQRAGWEVGTHLLQTE
mmetsp:Transcript_239/g.711  ORF Transcript_239/g.711 Transcript_239/m.711 type:complete len:369 (+) Transcript_239:517-1623(+)